MKILTVNQAMTLFILIMLVLICGFSGISYGEDALTILDVQCEADGVAGTILSVTVKATIRANRDIENIRGWLTINERIISLIPKEFGGGKSLGDLSAGQTKSFSITEPGSGVKELLVMRNAVSTSSSGKSIHRRNNHPRNLQAISSRINRKRPLVVEPQL